MRTFLKLLLNELKKEKSLIVKHKLDWFLEILVLVAFFYFLCLIRFSKDIGQVCVFLKGYTLWFYSVLIIWDVSNKVSEERATGIYQQYYLSIYPLYLIHLIKVLTSVIKSAFLMCILYLSILYLFSLKCDYLELFNHFAVMLFILPMLLGMSFFMGGLTIFLKKIAPIKSILNYLLLFCSGVFFSLNQLPPYLATIAKILPVSIGFQIANDLNSKNISILSLVSYQLYFFAIFFSGLFFYHFIEKYALKKGRLEYY